MAELVTKKRVQSSVSLKTDIPPGKKLKTIVAADTKTQTTAQSDQEEMVVSNPVILARIFSSLSPPDPKTAALVCRTWRTVLELPVFWAWARVRLGRLNFSERRLSWRLRHVGGVLSELDLTSRQLRSLLGLVADRQTSLSSLHFSGPDLSAISPQL